MTKEDIIRMAREAGLLEIIDDAYQERADWGDYVERFATLVAAAERERIKAENAPVIENINKYLDEMRAAIRARSKE